MRGRILALVGAALLGAGPNALEGQDTSAGETEVVARALQAQLGLLSGLGSEVAGSAGTLGRRLGAAPRVAVSVRTAFAHVGVPDLSDPMGPPSRESDYVLPAVHVGVAAGLFDGFSLVPTLGGILSVDALASSSVVFLPGSEGFDGRATGVSLGARIGLLRESFTVPGVAVSVSRRWIGEASVGDVEGGDRASVSVDPVVTSVRATVGKDLLSVGVMAGVGWDDYGGQWTSRTAEDGRTRGPTGLDQSRRLYFGAASLNFLILQLSGELGWAEGFEPVPGYLGAPFDLTEGDLFASLAFRLTI